MITCYLKVTNFCNVGCDFCYLPESSRSNNDSMSLQALEGAIGVAQRLCLSERANGITFVIHGGEPLTVPISSLQQILARLRLVPNSSISLQTSLIPLRPAHRALIDHYFDFGVGTSIDFSGRTVGGSSEDYIELWLKKVELLRSWGKEAVPIFVPSVHDLGRERELVEFMLKNEFWGFQIERYNDFGNNKSDRPSNKQHAQFLIALTDVLLEYAKKGVYIANNVLSAAISGVVYGQPGDRWGTACTRQFLVVNPDGSTNYCPDRIEQSESFSNVGDGGIEFLESAARRDVIVSHALNHENAFCSSCQYNSWCKTGCPITPNIPESEGDCSGYKSFLNHVACLDQALLDDYLDGARSPGDYSHQGGYRAAI